MPPAFVLSQNQTLKLMSDNHPGESEEEAGISGSRSCTSHILWICNETYEGSQRSELRRHPGTADFYRPDDTQRISPTGAAAHMSLHLNRQCQRADTPPSPCPGQPGYRLRRRKRGRASDLSPSVNSHIWRRFPPVNSCFAKAVRSFRPAVAGENRHGPASAGAYPDGDAVRQRASRKTRKIPRPP
jgi:hypothetical protein